MYCVSTGESPGGSKSATMNASLTGVLTEKPASKADGKSGEIVTHTQDGSNITLPWLVQWIRKVTTFIDYIY
jgi:hypothetical protein